MKYKTFKTNKPKKARKYSSNSITEVSSIIESERDAVPQLSSGINDTVKVLWICFFSIVIQAAVASIMIAAVSFQELFGDNPNYTLWFTNVLKISSQIVLVSNGSGVDLFGIDMKFTPLGSSLITILIIYLVVKIFKPEKIVAVFFISGLYSILIFSLSIFSSTTDSHIDASPKTGFVFSFVISFLAALMGSSKGSFFNRLYLKFNTTHNEMNWYNSKIVSASLRSSVASVAIAMAYAVILTFFSTIYHYQSIGSILDFLNVDPLSIIVLSIVELIVLPNIIIWNMSILLGTGFTEGSIDPLHQLPIPILHSIDYAIVSNTLSIAVWCLVIVSGIVSSFLIWRWTKEAFFVVGYASSSLMKQIGRVLYFVATVSVSIVLYFIGMCSLASVSSGSINVGRLGEVGVNWFAFGFHITWGYLIGCIIGSLPLAVIRFVRPEKLETSYITYKVDHINRDAIQKRRGHE